MAAPAPLPAAAAEPRSLRLSLSLCLFAASRSLTLPNATRSFGFQLFAVRTLSSFSIVRRSSCHSFAAIIGAVSVKKEQKKKQKQVVFATLGRAGVHTNSNNNKAAALATLTEAYAWRKFCMPLHAWLSECTCGCLHIHARAYN